MAPFSSDEIQHFMKHGYVYLRNAFDASLASEARDILWEDHLNPDGIFAANQTTWVARHGIKQVYKPDDDGPPWYYMFTPKLYEAINQLVGTKRWDDQEFGFGWWVISFPFMEGDRDWGATGKWHIDGAHFKHRFHSGEQGLLPIFLFSDINEHEGGTALLPGSHIAATRFLYEDWKAHGGAQQGCSSADIVNHLLNHNPELFECPIEVTGNAGDVCFTHPLLVHARSKNLSTRGAEGIRFICNPCIRLFRDLKFDRSVDADHSPLESVARVVMHQDNHETYSAPFNSSTGNIGTEVDVVGLNAGFNRKRAMDSSTVSKDDNMTRTRKQIHVNPQ